jgi:hypothetical protein
LQGVARELVAKLHGGIGLGFDLVDLLAHPLEGVEGAGIGDPGHRVLDGLLRLGSLLARDEDVLLALGLLDLVVERAQLLLELVDGIFLQLGLLAELGELAVVLGLALEGLLGQVFVAGAHCQHGLAFPLLPQIGLLVALLFQTLLVGNRDCHLLFRLDELVLHVEDDLVQHLLRILGLGDDVVDVGLEQRSDARKDSHGGFLCLVRLRPVS